MNRRTLTFTREQIEFLIDHPSISAPLGDVFRELLAADPNQQTFELTLTGPIDSLPPKPPSS